MPARIIVNWTSMRFFSTLAVVLFLGVFPTTTKARHAGAQPEFVQRIVAAAAGHPFGESRSRWRSARPAASWLQYRGSPDDIRSTAREGPDGLWCAVATDVVDGLEREAVFYAIREERPLDCRLEELRYSAVPRADAPPLYDALDAALKLRFGESSSLVSDWDRASRTFRLGTSRWGRPSGRWRHVRMWHLGTSFVFLYRLGDRIEVLTRSFVLNADLEVPPPSATMTRHGMSRLTWELVNAVRARFPEAATVMQSSEGVVDQDAVERSALGLLAAINRARSANERVMLALVAGQVMSRFHLEGATPLAGRPSIAPILRYGVTFAESPYDEGIWYYDGKFTDEIVQRAPPTFLSGLATVEKIDNGWIGDCAPAIDPVIREGTRWLALNPRSEFAPRVTFDVAQAHDTAWSVSVAPAENEPETTPQPPGNTAARLHAIEWYERLVRQAPSSSEAVIARRRLQQLRLRLDTSERRYFCEYG